MSGLKERSPVWSYHHSYPWFSGHYHTIYGQNFSADSPLTRTGSVVIDMLLLWCPNHFRLCPCHPHLCHSSCALSACWACFVSSSQNGSSGSDSQTPLMPLHSFAWVNRFHGWDSPGSECGKIDAFWRVNWRRLKCMGFDFKTIDAGVLMHEPDRSLARFALHVWSRSPLNRGWTQTCSCLFPERFVLFF